MKITYSHDCSVIDAFLNNPGDRESCRKFKRDYCHICSTLPKLHRKLTNANSAFEYNCVSSSDNKIEILKGTRERDPMILKVRITGKFRKLFHSITNGTDALITKNWVGQYKDVIHIHVIEINPHEYDK